MLRLFHALAIIMALKLSAFGVAFLDPKALHQDPPVLLYFLFRDGIFMDTVSSTEGLLQLFNVRAMTVVRKT